MLVWCCSECISTPGRLEGQRCQTALSGCFLLYIRTLTPFFGNYINAGNTKQWCNIFSELKWSESLCYRLHRYNIHSDYIKVKRIELFDRCWADVNTPFWKVRHFCYRASFSCIIHQLKAASQSRKRGSVAIVTYFTEACIKRKLLTANVFHLSRESDI
jgi:hypothetical protein